MKESGQILLLAIVVVGLVTVNTIMIATGSQTFFQSSNYSLQSSQAIDLAEAGIDKAVASLNASGGSYTGEAETALGAGSYSVIITTPQPGTKLIEATGYIPSKAQAKVKRTIKITAAKGVGVSFNYAVQSGEGGFEMSPNSQINGSIYSNGDIIMANNTKITGDAYVAGGTTPTADGQSDCQIPNCIDFLFGKTFNGQERFDVAQSFKPGSTNYLNKISLKLKKFDSPADIQVKIVHDSSGKPDKNNVLASGVLPATLVTSQYGFVDVTFTTSPYLTTGTTYWILLDTSASSGYWAWSADGVQGYSDGGAAYSPNWQDNRQVWNSVALDLGFKTFMGGVITYINGSPGALIGGAAHANTLKNLSVTGGAYYQAIQNVTAGSFYPGSADPSVKVMPVSDSNIADWEDQATKAGIYTGDVSGCVFALGPGKYIGNVSITDNGCNVTIKDPVWITGNFSVANNATVKLDSSYNTSSGVIIAGSGGTTGQITLNNNVRVEGSGAAGSFLTILSTYDSRFNGQNAILVNNGGDKVAFYAGNGIIEVQNTNTIKELTAWKIKLNNGVIVNYEDGLSSLWFSSGPSGAYTLVRGTYQLK